MNITNSQEYYNTPSRFGEYQYVTLKEVIDNFMMSRDSDDYHGTTPRFKVLFQAMRGLREFYYDVVREVRAIELELSPTLSVTLPPDYINYVRISWVDDKGHLRPMSIDTTMSIAQEYLQDNDHNILFDNEGCVLIGNSETQLANAQNTSNTGDRSKYAEYSFCSTFNPNQDLSKVYTNGKYNIDKSRGIIQFGSDAMGKLVVLEYISDGLYTGCEGKPEEEIRIHKFAEGALMDFIYYELIKNRRRVPANEKHRARKEFYNSRKNTKQRINALRVDELLQVFKGSTKWIK